MTREEFRKVADEFLSEMEKKLGVKREEYADDRDALINFKRGSRIFFNEPRTPIQVAFDYAKKHLVSVIQFVEDSSKEDKEFFNRWPKEKVMEKLTDLANYLLLMYALYVERGEE